jgi:DNA-nicking Smr family endonuclease
MVPPKPSGRRRTALSAEDRAAWAAYARQVHPLPGRAAAPPPEATAEAPPPEPTSAAPPPPPVRSAAPTPSRTSSLDIGAQPAGLDSASWQRFRSGRLSAARRLDLHGYTAQRGFMAVSHFLRVAHADHVRCVEIVTGRGGRGEGARGEGEGGVLRRELPLWLNLPELRPLVLAASYPHPANPGAVRVLLRRVR